MKNITKYIALAAVVLSMAACREELDPKSIFIDKEEAKEVFTSEFDAWLKAKFTTPYNVEYVYRLDDNATDPNYNVVPVSIGKADTLAHLALYLWYEPYDLVTKAQDSDTAKHVFLRENGPKIIQLIGSAEINAAQGTEKLGEASGGNKITLMKINKMETKNIVQLNEYVFKTMHHEFGHILHQKKPYPKDWEFITPGDYDPSTWNDLTDREANERGFVSPYSRNNYNDDFVETLANYVVKSDKDWQTILNNAKNGEFGDMSPAIEQKLSMVREYLDTQWGVNLEELRNLVQERQQDLDFDKIWEMYK